MRLSLKAEQRQRRNAEVNVILARLLDPEEIIDRFDATYVDDLPELLREIHGVTEANAHTHSLAPDLMRIWELAGRDEAEFTLAELPGAARDAGVDEDRFSPRQ